jgi:hypothetical protein
MTTEEQESLLCELKWTRRISWFALANWLGWVLFTIWLVNKYTEGQ